MQRLGYALHFEKMSFPMDSFVVTKINKNHAYPKEYDV
jgi:hypothetical protein